MSVLNESTVPTEQFGAHISPDAELIARCQNELDQADQELVARYQAHVARIAYQVLGNQQDADDVTREVFAKVGRELSSLDPQQDFLLWLFRLTVNTAVDYLRLKKCPVPDLSSDEQPGFSEKLPGSDLNSLTFEFESGTLLPLIKNLADRLRPNQKTILMMCDLQGLTTAETAEILGLKKVTLRWHLHEARKQLRRELINHPEYGRVS